MSSKQMTPEEQKRFDAYSELFCYHWSQFYRNQPRPEMQEVIDAYYSGLTPKEATEKMYWDRRGTPLQDRPTHGYSGSKAH